MKTVTINLSNCYTITIENKDRISITKDSVRIISTLGTCYEIKDCLIYYKKWAEEAILREKDFPISVSIGCEPYAHIQKKRISEYVNAKEDKNKYMSNIYNRLDIENDDTNTENIINDYVKTSIMTL